MEHHVYFWIKKDADHKAFEHGLETLLSIDTVVEGSWGRQAKTEERPVTDKTWTYALSLKFDSIADHDTYQVDEIHDMFVEANKDKWEKVLVMDMQ